MAKKNRSIAARLKNPEIIKIIDDFKVEYGISDSQLVRYILGKFFGREQEPLVKKAIEGEKK